MKGFIDDANYSVGVLDEGTNLENVIDNYVYEHTLTGKNAFFVGDLGKIVKKHSQWQNVVAQIKPFYTVKCNSSPAVLEILAALGIGFACSNKVSIFLSFFKLNVATFLKCQQKASFTVMSLLEAFSLLIQNLDLFFILRSSKSS
jgi:hypothetical protein